MDPRHSRAPRDWPLLSPFRLQPMDPALLYGGCSLPLCRTWDERPVILSSVNVTRRALCPAFGVHPALKTVQWKKVGWFMALLNHQAAVRAVQHLANILEPVPHSAPEPSARGRQWLPAAVGELSFQAGACVDREDTNSTALRVAGCAPGPFRSTRPFPDAEVSTVQHFLQWASLEAVWRTSPLRFTLDNTETPRK